MPPANTAPQPTVTCKVNDGLRGLLVPVDSLQTDARNARRHVEKDVKALAASLDAFGQQKPFVVLRRAGELATVIAGNGGLQAAKRLGWSHVAVVAFDDADRARAFALADNRTAELSAWDDDALLEALQEVNAARQMESTGFTARDLDEMIRECREGDVNDALLRLPSGERGTLATMTFTLATAQRAVVLDAIAAALRDARENDQGDADGNRNARGLVLLAQAYLAKAPR
jgi:ParB-like chromosome segregation protein Spo0J